MLSTTGMGSQFLSLACAGDRETDGVDRPACRLTKALF
jgi:hypothetical protein